MDHPLADFLKTLGLDPEQIRIITAQSRQEPEENTRSHSRPRPEMNPFAHATVMAGVEAVIKFLAEEGYNPPDRDAIEKLVARILVIHIGFKDLQEALETLLGAGVIIT